MDQKDEKTYEMLWDCEYCGTKKLLGKTHRHCPECGAVQDAQRRYFPEESEKVAVEDHEFVGADKHCASCQTANSAISKFCGNCGAPMEEGVEVEGVEDDFEPPSEAAPAQKPKKSNRVWLILAGVAVLIIGVLLVVFLWKQKVALTVTGHTWECIVHIERFGPSTQSDWCDHMPRNARNIFRSREVRSHKKIPDGETCKTKRVDNKDGTYTQKRVCTPKYRKEPIYADKCRYTIDKWKRFRDLKTTGNSLSEPVTWPKVNLPNHPLSRLGAERVGGRKGIFTVHLSGPEKSTHTCAFSEQKWRSFGLNTQWKGESGVLSDRLDCDSLVSAR